MKISFIGAGKVATAFGLYIRDKQNVEIIYYLSKTLDSAKKSAEMVNTDYTSDLTEVVKKSDIIFITTPDDKIGEVSDNISKLNINIKDKIFVHMSGALSSDVFSEFKKAGAKTVSLHPLLSFADINKAKENIKDAYFSVEGDMNDLLDFIKYIDIKYFEINKEDKVKYHLSAVIFSNYLVTLLNYGENILNSIDIKNGACVMKPLIDATLSNVYDKGSDNALTGPIRRCDIETIKKHISVLDGFEREIYIKLGKLTTDNLISDMDDKKKLDELWRVYG